ncbi:MAG: glycosyltransferase [Clostridia bacterium]|nr:glycosyltransferase [Clostridia bacterium]
MENKKKYFNVARSVYLCGLMVYSILREVIPLQWLVGNGLVVAGVFGLGFLLIAASLWLDRDHATKANVGLFIAFVGVCGISTLVNFKYEFVSNVKAIAWTCLFLFLVYPCGFYQKERREKELTSLFTSAIITLGIAVLISLPMYFFNLHYTYVTAKQFDNVLPQGFHREYLRLWGVFIDPNTAAVYSFVAILMSAYLFKKKKNIAARILLVFVDVLFFLLIVLSGSRTAKVAVVIACAWLAVYSTYTLLKKNKRLQQLAFSAVSMVLAVVAAYGAMTVTAHALPKIKKGVNSLLGASAVRTVHGIYDDLYAATDLNIIDGYLKEGEQNSGGDLEEDPIGRPDLEGKEDLSNGRFDKWKDYLKIFMASPLFGTSPRGVSAFGKDHCPETDVAKYGYASHNFLLEILTGTGIVGFLIVVLFLFNALVLVLRKTLRERFAFQYLLYSGILLTLVCSSMFLSDLFFNVTFGGFAMFLALGLVNGETKYLSESELPENTDGKTHVLVYGPKDPVGGVEKIVFEYVRSITATQKDVTFDYLVYGENFSMEEDLAALGCRTIYLPSRKKHYFAYKKALERVFSETRYAAVWGNYSGLTNIDLLVLAKKYHVPVRIAHSHASRLYWGSALMKPVVYTLHYYNRIWLQDYATAYWACSDVAGDFMFPKSAGVQVIPNAVDTTKFYPDEAVGAQVRSELGLQDSVAIGHVARLCEVKNQKFLLGVVAAAVKREPKTKLLLVGDGELREALQAEAQALGIAENVVFLGERKDVPDLLRAMDVFVLTSYAEGLSVSAVEAQASGVPCVVPTTVSAQTDVSGFVEFVPLDASYDVWAERVLACAAKKTENAAEKVEESGFGMRSAAETVFRAFVQEA